MADQGSDNPSGGNGGFKVTDRRRSAQGEQQQEQKQEQKPEQKGEQQRQGETQPPRPPLDFTTFILSFASTALVQMGLAPDPVSGERMTPDPQAARETIDILGLLREKTRGNLSEEEQKFFDALLYDLRVRFVELTRGGPAGP